MNKLILIGNGFDLAHGLKTSYQDFIDGYWEEKVNPVKYAYKCDRLIYRRPEDRFPTIYEDDDIKIDKILYFSMNDLDRLPEKYGYENFIQILAPANESSESCLQYKNQFLQQIMKKKYLKNWPDWVDIEMEYYLALKKCSNNSDKEEIEKLNSDFLAIQKALERYLIAKIEDGITVSQSISDRIYSVIDAIIRNKYSRLESIMFLNFNYTPTIEKYTANRLAHTDAVNYIHGELGNPNNPIIFGYGDEIDDKYKFIEQINDNRYLENIKSIRYLETKNYQKLLAFMDSDKYEIFIMGHSCGISDRTLLNTVFEHKNCCSIKFFYHRKKDGTDNFSDVIRNISRNFTNKPLMRKRVVNKNECEPLLI